MAEDVAVVHIFDRRSWWSGEVFMLCGEVMRPGGNERVWFRWGERLCRACERAEKGDK